MTTKIKLPVSGETVGIRDVEDIYPQKLEKLYTGRTMEAPKNAETPQDRDQTDPNELLRRIRDDVEALLGEKMQAVVSVLLAKDLRELDTWLCYGGSLPDSWWTPAKPYDSLFKAMKELAGFATDLERENDGEIGSIAHEMLAIMTAAGVDPTRFEDNDE